MKNFKIILIVTLILDVIQFIPLVLAKMGGEMKNQMISDFNIEGLANSAPALEVLDIMLYIFGFIYLGTVLSVIYTLRLKTLEGLKSATFVLFIVHLFWTLPDFVTLIKWRFSPSANYNYDFNFNSSYWIVLCFTKGRVKNLKNLLNHRHILIIQL
jgi:hypothetical protein